MINLFKNKEFFYNMMQLAVPIALQHLVASSLNMIDAVMVGQLGEKAIAGVTIANQIFFVLNLLLFGTFSGASIFAAQFWGKKDIHGVKIVLGISLSISCCIALLFTLGSALFPRQIIGIFSEDPEVIQLGAQFLFINAFSFLPFAISFGYAQLLRSTGIVKLPMMASILALSLNTVINYLIISGRFGFPALGVQGASLATLISRLVEVVIIVFVIYYAKYPIAAGLKEMLSFDMSFVRRYIKTSFPVIVHEGLWSTAMTVYTFIYGHMGTNAVASISIVSTIDRLALVLFFGLSNACSIMVGHKIGEGNFEEAYKDSKRYLIISPIIGAFVSLCLIVSYPGVFSLFNVSSEVKQTAANLILIMALVIPVRVINFIMIVGVTRAGGDTRFTLFMENIPLWFIAIPLAAFSGLYLKLPLQFVYLLAFSEEVIKMVLGFQRFVSRKWIHYVIHG